MKKRKIIIMSLLLMMLSFLIPSTAYAEGGGTGSGGSGHGGQSGTTKFDYWWSTDYGKHYIKITAYTYSGSPGERPQRISNTVIFTNKWNDKTFSKGILYAKNNPSDKLSYLDGNVSMSVGHGKPYMVYLSFPNLGSDALKNWFLQNVIYEDDNDIIRTVNSAIGLDENKLKRVKGYYYIVESMGYANYGYAGGSSKQNELHFFGTSYEMGQYMQKNSGSYPTIQTWVATALYIPTTQAPDPNGFVGKIFSQLDPKWDVSKKNCDGCSKLKWKDLVNYRGYGLNVFWKERAPFTCKKEFNSNFPIDPNTHEVMPVVLNSDDNDDATIATQADIDAGIAVNCCNQLLVDVYGNDKDKLCDERPECCYNCDPGRGREEHNPGTCTTSTSGEFQNTGNDKDSWYCMKAFDQYSPYKKADIAFNGTNVARIVCRESLITDFPKQLIEQQSVGTYMIWPTSSDLQKNNYEFKFYGTMTCKLSIDKAEIESRGNKDEIYAHIYNQSKQYATSDAAAGWYNLNPNSNIRISYNDDEYGGVFINLVKDQSNTSVNYSDNGDSNWYKKLNSFTITIQKDVTYKLPNDAYNKLTTSGIGSSTLSNMFDKINKNQFVQGRFNYGILPISYKATPSRNYSVNKTNFYRLTIRYNKIGDNGQFAIGDQDYTCPYEVTFAPPSNNENTDKCATEGICNDDEHDDNNEGYEKETDCKCPQGTAYCEMSLKGYLIKNKGMTCAEAQRLYCNGGRGHMNVEYRVISLIEPFPGIQGIPYANGGRKIGYNWRDYWSNPFAGEVVKNVIINNRNVVGYEVYNKTPLYRIELDSATIKAIRDYNRTTNYADFTLTCRDTNGKGKRCISNFLRGSNGVGVGNLLSSGTCATATSYDNFYSCADKPDPGTNE